MRINTFKLPTLLIVLAFSWSGLAMAQFVPAPDPDIFDGSQIPPEKSPMSSLAKILQKRPQMGIPGPMNTEGRQQQNQGVEGKESSKHQKGEGEKQGEGEGEGDQEGKEGEEGEEGSGFGDESEMIEEDTEGALGGELEEVDESALAEAEEQEGMGGTGEESLEEQQGGNTADEESQQGGPGQMGQSGRPVMAKVSVGDPSEMIDIIKMEGTDNESIQTDAGATNPKKPMVGKNKGQSLGMEEGDTIPSDI